MTTDEKLAAILAAIQTDPGHRGLAELFKACPDDFAAACRSIAHTPLPLVDVVTGFIIPSVDPPLFETDGPLGAVFLARALEPLDFDIHLTSDPGCRASLNAGLSTSLAPDRIQFEDREVLTFCGPQVRGASKRSRVFPTHVLALERVGPSTSSQCYTMRGQDITNLMLRADQIFTPSAFEPAQPITIGIGDGGNEIGMGKIPHDIVARTIPNGDLIHCRVPTDHLIVAGVSNWGAYALAAGIFVLKGIKPPPDLFDPDREREILEVMVREGPLVDGVTGKQTATVDGLSWEEYAKPLIRLREILQ